MVWAGARVGFDHVGIPDTNLAQFPVTMQMPSSPGELSATRFYGGGLLGLAAGFRHLHVALELDATYQTLAGSYFNTSVSVAGLSLVPAGALWVDF
jgi:hypothetical protein